MKHPLLLTAAVLSVIKLTAAPITWGPATAVGTGVGNSSDVSTNGTPVEAFHLQGGGATPASPVVNGVTFVGTTALLPGTAGSGGTDFSNDTDGGDASYDTLLSDLEYGGGGDQFSISIGGGALSVGAPYEVQIWFVDDRGSQDARVMQFGDGNGNTVDLNDAYSIGTFTADGTSQTLTLDAQGFGNAHFNAYQLRALGPPPAPDVPTNLIATKGDEEITLNWDDNTQFGFANFIVRRSTSMGGPYSDVPGATPTASTWTDTGLTNGTTYYYVVAAENTLGQISANSDEASATPEIFVPDPPTVPTGLAVTPGNNLNILNWDDNTQPGFLEFRIKRSTTMGGPYTQIGNTANSVFNDITAVNGTNYYYIVTAVNIDLVESIPGAEEQGEPSPSAEPPNFLFIITDDQDFYSVNAYRTTEPTELTAGGQPYVVDTPNIDRLAVEGMLFHQARLMGANSGAVCRPSRTMIMSGKNTWQSTQGVTAATTFPGIFNRGVRSGLSDLPHATYRTCKSGNSYATANAEFTIVNDATRRGNTDGNGSEWHTGHAIDYLEHWRTNHRTNGKPFFIYLGFSHPHDTRNVRTTPDLESRYHCINNNNAGGLVLDPLSPPLPINHLPVNEALGIPANYPFHPFDHGHLGVRDENTVDGIDQYRTEAVVRNEIGRNFACVDWIDRNLGEVFAKLEDPDGDGNQSDSVINNTYIVFTSDHGIAIGRHGLQGKQNLYEHTWRVPYIVRGPGIAAGSETDALVYLHDTFPTFCDLAGLDVPGTIDANDGQSFRDVLEGNSTGHRDVLYGLYAGGNKPGMRAVTDGRFKMIKYDVASDAVQETQLFDLQTNPFELLDAHGVPNLATQPAYAGIRQRLEEELMQQRLDNADPYAFLGDRTLLRFEDGTAGQPAGTLLDRLPFENDGTAVSGTGGALPVFSADVPNATDYVAGEANTRSLDFEADNQNYVQVADARELDFGDAPFTIEAWVKLETLPTGDNLASRKPVAMKKIIGDGDGALDYMFLAAAGSHGDAVTYKNLGLHLGSGVVISDLFIPDTNWHYISAAFDSVSNLVRFTLDDQSDTKATAHFGTENNGPLVIGAHYDGTGTLDVAFDGLIDELSITDGFLDLAELQPLRAVAEVQGFRILDFQLSPGGTTFSLTFESDETRLYTIQRSTTLAPGSWTDVQSFIPGATGTGETTVIDLPIDPAADNEFFRVST